MVEYLNLFDIEQRPGSGVGLWSGVVERQLERVKAINYRHRLHLGPAESEREEHPEAESELHGEVYFLVLAIRRLMLFAEALAKQVDEERLAAALALFETEAPGAREVRNLFEHVDEYLLDTPGKHMRRISGRVAPVLISCWDADNVVIAYGEERFDVTLAALAAIELGETALEVWMEELERVKASEERDGVPSEDDGILRAMEIEIGASTVIEGGESGPEVRTGRLLDVRLREIDEQEAERLQALEGEPARVDGEGGGQWT
jgi:hypothetical protein